MSNGTSSARYTDLYNYSRIATQIDQYLIYQADRLISRLSYFEATCEEPGFRVSSDGLGSALRSYGTRCEPIDQHVQEVGEAFQRADSSLWGHIIAPPGTVPIIGIPGWRWPWPDLRLPWRPPRWKIPPIFEIPWVIPPWWPDRPSFIVRPPWRWQPWLSPVLPWLPIFGTPISIMPILPSIPGWIRGPVITTPERSPFGDLIDEAPSETPLSETTPVERTKPQRGTGPLIDNVDDAKQYHFNSFLEWYEYGKEQEKGGDALASADCGPASLIMALEILKLKIGKDQIDTRPRGEALKVMRPEMVTDETRDGLTQGGEIAWTEHQGEKAYTDLDDVKRGAKNSGAKCEIFKFDEKLGKEEKLDKYIESIEDALRSGGVIVASGTFIDKDPDYPWFENRPDRNSSNSPGKAGDHVIAVVGITQEGKFIVNDPSRIPPPFEVDAEKLKDFMRDNEGAATISK